MKTKNRNIRFAVLSSIVLLALGVAIWWNYPVLRFHLSLLRVTSSSHLVEFEVNTFNDEVNSSTITSLYYAACKKARAIVGDAPQKTFLGHDQFGWGRWMTVVQQTDRYIEVCLIEGNDSQTVSFSIRSGAFNPADLRLLRDETLPEGVVTRISWP